MDQYRDHVTAMNWAAAHGAAGPYKDVSATDFLPFYESANEEGSLDKQAMEVSRRFAKLGV